ncbi:MAG: glycosyltransferase [Alphaproteobacteria bacterium]|nr:glycosyltransferase [Alphaproteobacteria bacterium]
MKFLVATVGSIGDLLPFLVVAEALRQRGHTVVIASNAGYAALVKMAGFEFAAIWDRSQQSIDSLIASDPLRAWAAVRDDMLVPAAAPTRAFIAHHLQKGPCTVLASWSSFGARLAHDELGVPLCTVYLSPGAVGADEDHRADELGHRNIGLFPAWFGTHAGVRSTGFAMYEDALVPPLPADAESFLAAGAPPVIFTPGSFMRSATTFFQQSLEACAQLGLRAIFLTPYREHLPASLPPSIRHFSYLALQRLAPRCAALVHHGGIGTCAQGLRAGIPQLATPLFFDQPDNAARLAALGVGRDIAPNAYRAGQAAAKLREMLASETVRQDCARASALFRDQDGAGLVCDLVETMT